MSKIALAVLVLSVTAALANAAPILNVSFGTTAGDNFQLGSGGRWDLWIYPLSQTVDGHQVLVTANGANWLHNSNPSVGIIPRDE